MKVRIIPGAATQDRLRALVLADASGTPPVRLEDPRGGPAPALKLTAHLAGEAVDQHVIRGGVYLTLAEATGLRPGRDYHLRAGDGPPVHARTLPDRLPREGINLALASCYYEHFRRDRDYLRALQAPPGYRPLAAKLLVGDNVYVDVGRPPGRARSGAEETIGRYLEYYWRGGYADVLSYLPTYALWDDHELWNNFPERQVYLGRTFELGGRDGYASAGLAAIRLFQAALNPPPVAREGLSYAFAVPPLSCFALDLRAGRTRMQVDAPRMTSEAELAAFERWAAGLQGPGVLLVGQPLWMERGSWKDYHPPDFAAQYARIWRALTAAPYDVLVLSGDVHHSRLLELDLGGGRRVFELVSSPACMIPTIESIAAGAHDVQDRGRLTFPTAWPGAPGGAAPRLAAYHFGTDCPNTIAFLRLVPAAGDGVAVSTCFFDLVTKTITKNQPPAVAAPLARPQPAWCQGEPAFTLRKRT